MNKKILIRKYPNGVVAPRP